MSRSLRVLYVPLFSSPKMLRTCATWNWAKTFFRYWVDTRPDAFVYFPIPKDQMEEPDLVKIDHPRIMKIPISVSRSQYLEAADLQPEYDQFNPYTGNYPVDVIFCDKNARVGALRSRVFPLWEAVRAPVVVATDAKFIFDSHESGMTGLDQSWEREQVLGWSMADVNVFRTDGEYARAEKICRKYLSPSLLLKIMESRFVGGIGNSLTTLDKFYKKDKPTSPLVVSWAYGMTEGYHLSEVFETIDNLFRGGRKIRVLITSPSTGPGRAGNRALLGKRCYFDMHFGLVQEEFYEKVSSAHVFMFFPVREKTLSYSVLEQAYLGLVGIYPRGRLRPVTVPDDYPFLFEGTVEALAHLRWIVDNWGDPKIEKAIESVRNLVAEKYSGLVDAEAIIGRIEAAHEKKYASGLLRKYVRDICEDTMKGRDRITWAELVKSLNERGSFEVLGENSIIYMNHTQLSMALIRWAMREVGFADTGQTAEPEFCKVTPSQEKVS